MHTIYVYSMGLYAGTPINAKRKNKVSSFLPESTVPLVSALLARGCCCRRARCAHCFALQGIAGPFSTDAQRSLLTIRVPLQPQRRDCKGDDEFPRRPPRLPQRSPPAPHTRTGAATQPGARAAQLRHSSKPSECHQRSLSTARPPFCVVRKQPLPSAATASVQVRITCARSFPNQFPTLHRWGAGPITLLAPCHLISQTLKRTRTSLVRGEKDVLAPCHHLLFHQHHQGDQEHLKLSDGGCAMPYEHGCRIQMRTLEIGPRTGSDEFVSDDGARDRRPKYDRSGRMWRNFLKHVHGNPKC